MITRQKFNGILKSITATGGKLDALIADGIQYCVEQAQQHGNFDSFSKLATACPVYARSIVHAAEKAARKTHKERNWRDDAAETARSTAVDELATRRAVSASKRAAPNKGANDDKAAPTDTRATSAKVKQWQLVASNGDTLEKMALTFKEYTAALEAVQALREASRAPRLAAANKVAKAEKKMASS